MDPQQVSDHLEIRDLIDRYSIALTRKSWDEMGSVFHEHAEWRCAQPFPLHFKTRKGIQDGLSGIVSQSDFIVQMLHSVAIDLDGDRATTCIVLNEMSRNEAKETGHFLLGTYNDVITRIDGRWGFESRLFLPIYHDATYLPGTVVPGNGDIRTLPRASQVAGGRNASSHHKPPID